MLARNLAAIRYRNYHVFVGVYPNDRPTVRAVSTKARRHRRVHMAVGPHDGPTSKGDCLNWTYRYMQEFEARHGMRFRVVMTHDAEDVVHPDSLRMINWFSRKHGMVQIPVLPLPTPAREWTHGLYCDEFAEYQTKDIPVRQRTVSEPGSRARRWSVWRSREEGLRSTRSASPRITKPGSRFTPWGTGRSSFPCSPQAQAHPRRTRNPAPPGNTFRDEPALPSGSGAAG